MIHFEVFQRVGEKLTLDPPPVYQPERVNDMWKVDNPEGSESLKVKWDLVPYTKGRGIDVGCGMVKPFEHFIGIDAVIDSLGRPCKAFDGGMQPDIHAQGDDLSMFASQSLDFVFSSHLLEHLVDTEKVLKEWWRVLKVGGNLCLYLPHKDFYPNMGHAHANPDHKHDFLPQDIIDVMKKVGGWDLLENQSRNQDEEYSFFQVFQKKGNNKAHFFSCDKPKPAKSVGIVRYGAYGDVIQAASVLPVFKKRGYHVTFYTTPRGYSVLKDDPHVDRFIVQDDDQVPNHLLGEFWTNESKKYTEFYNLSESVEGILLHIAGRISFNWPRSLRHKVANVNYLERTHDICDVPHEFHQKFYPAAEEKDWAKKERSRIGGRLVVWSLSGSSVHKVWPHLDAVVARILLTYPDVKVALVGDEMCQILEAGWHQEARVLKKSGRWNIRQAMTMAQHADLVIGPETGLLNAVGHEDVYKIVTLSHSTEENLTKHWKNTIPLVCDDKVVPCYPCHVLHYSFQYCHQDPLTHTALCQSNISAEQMWRAVRDVLNGNAKESTRVSIPIQVEHSEIRRGNQSPET